MGTLIENASAVASCATAIDAAIVAKGGTLVGGGKLRNAAAGIAAIPSGETWPKAWVGSGSHIWLKYDSDVDPLDKTLTLQVYYVNESGASPYIDWGDGTTTSMYSATSESHYDYSHTYTADGEYRVDVCNCIKSKFTQIQGYVALNNNMIRKRMVYQIEMDHDDLESGFNSNSYYYGWGCLYNLRAIRLPNATKVKWLGAYFPQLDYFYAPNAVEVDSIAMWYTNYPLSNVTLPSEMTSLVNFYSRNIYVSGASNLKSLVMPKCGTFSNYGFLNMKSLEEVTFASGVTNIPDSFLYGCSALKRCVFPSTVTTIQGETLREAANLEYLDLPAGWTGTNSGFAFYAVWSLTTLIVRATTPPPLTSSNNFSNTPSTIKVYVPQGCVSAYEEANIWSKFAGKIYELDADGNIPTA